MRPAGPRIVLRGLAWRERSGRPSLSRMPVIENLEAAAAATGLGRRAARDLAWDILAWLRLTDQADRRAGPYRTATSGELASREPLHSDPRSFFSISRPPGSNEPGARTILWRPSPGCQGFRLRPFAHRAQHAGSSWECASASKYSMGDGPSQKPLVMCAGIRK